MLHSGREHGGPRLGLGKCHPYRVVGLDVVVRRRLAINLLIGAAPHSVEGMASRRSVC
jgi:hypothetical protein